MEAADSLILQEPAVLDVRAMTLRLLVLSYESSWTIAHLGLAVASDLRER